MPVINTYSWQISLRNVIYLILQAKNLKPFLCSQSPPPAPDFCIHIPIYLLSVLGNFTKCVSPSLHAYCTALPKHPASLIGTSVIALQLLTLLLAGLPSESILQRATRVIG